MNRGASSSVWGSRVNTHLLVHHPSPSLVTHLHGRLAILGRNNQSQFVGKVLGQHHVLHLETSTRDKAGPPPVQPLIPSVTCLPIHPFRTPNQRGHGGYPPSFWDLPRGALRPSSTLSIRSDPAGSALCVLTMPLVGPVTLSSVAFPWVVFLLYSEVSLHHGTQSFRKRIYPPLGGRFVETTRQAGRGVRLVIRVPLRPVDKESDQATDTTPSGRQASTRVRIYLHHLCTKPRRVPENLMGIREVVKYLCMCSQQPIDHPSTHAHYQDLIENLGEQQDALHKVHDLFRVGM